jgi:hypothetical protein
MGMSLSAAACSLSSTQNEVKVYSKECVIPQDQSGTISGKWPVTPIPVAVAQGNFDDAETADITAALDSWNDFFKASKGNPIFDYGVTTDSSGTKSGTLRTSTATSTTQSAFCAKGILQGTQFTGNVVIYKISAWPAKYSSSAIALTSFCTTPSSSQTYPRMHMAAMEVNYKNFFAQGQKLPDLQSIILHELGHLIGLNHTCEASAKSGVPSCNDPNLSPDYISASMFPVFTFDQTGMGQQKRDLQTNDQTRTNCVY